MSDSYDPSIKLLGSEEGKNIASMWRGLWLDKISELSHMKRFKEINKEAYNINVNFLKPLQDRFTIRGVADQSLNNQFMRAAMDNEPQILNGLKAMSRYGVKDDQNLVTLAEKIKASHDAVKNITKLDLDTAIEKIGENQALASEAMQVLSKMDPIMRAEFADLERIAIAASNSKPVYQKLAKEAEDYFTKYGKLANMKYSSVESMVNKTGTGRYSSVNLRNQKTDAAEGIRNLYSFMNNGDEQAANKALDQLQKLREIGMLDKRQIQGSRQTAQATAIAMGINEGVGAITGVKIPAFAAGAGGAIVNTFADKFTSGKWTSLTPWLIEKMMNPGILRYTTGLGRGLLGGAVARSISEPAFGIEIQPGSPDAMAAIEILRNDKKLNSKEKAQAIKKINEEGIVIGMGE
jgi:hypothetical protein